MQFHEEKGLDKRRKIGYTCKADDFTGRRRLGMSKDLRFAMLLDCYGEFLTPHQYRLTELYYCADLSLSEIAEIVGITRQGCGTASSVANRFCRKWKTSCSLRRGSTLCGKTTVRSPRRYSRSRHRRQISRRCRPPAARQWKRYITGWSCSEKNLQGEEITWHLRDFPEN